MQRRTSHWSHCVLCIVVCSHFTQLYSVGCVMPLPFPLFFLIQALAHQHLHLVCSPLFCLWHLRHVHVLLVQNASQGAWGRRCSQTHGRGHRQLPTARISHGATSRCYGYCLLSCFCGELKGVLVCCSVTSHTDHIIGCERNVKLIL